VHQCEFRFVDDYRSESTYIDVNLGSLIIIKVNRRSSKWIDVHQYGYRFIDDYRSYSICIDVNLGLSMIIEVNRHARCVIAVYQWESMLSILHYPCRWVYLSESRFIDDYRFESTCIVVYLGLSMIFEVNWPASMWIRRLSVRINVYHIALPV